MKPIFTPVAPVTAATMDEKTKALFLKLRKGADASLSIGQLFKVLAQLPGWTVEEIVGITPMQYNEEKGGSVYMAVEGEEAARKIYDVFAARVVDELPTNPELGASYVQCLTPFAAMPPGFYKPNHFGAKFSLYVGTPGYRITAPEGEMFDILPRTSDVRDGFMDFTALPTIGDPKALKRRLRHWDAMRWLKTETCYLAQINVALGMEPHQPAAQRTRENTGTCGCCFRNIKLDHEHLDREEHPTMALHGYFRPGDGDIRGRCNASAWYAPYELSVEATTVESDSAAQRLAGCIKYLDEVTSPDFDKFTTYNRRDEPVFHKKGDHDWASQLGYLIDQAKRNLADARTKHAIYAWLVAHWELRALPTEGTREPDYWTPAVRAVLAATEKGD